MERGTVRGPSAEHGRVTVFSVGGLPVNGLQTLVEFGRAGKFPLAEDGPENDYTTNAGSYYNESSQSSALGLIIIILGSTAQLISSRRLLRGGGGGCQRDYFS